MLFTDIISPDRVSLDTNSLSKTAVLLHVSQLLSRSQSNLDAQELFAAFWNREALGSTAIGHGVTIPHLRMDNILKSYACFLKLKNPVDFGAEDKQPVDLVLGFITPAHETEQHLTLLAGIMEKFNHADFRHACRHAVDERQLHELLTQYKAGSTTVP